MPYFIFKELKFYFKKYSYDNILILAPSVKSERSPIRSLANLLSKFNIPIYVPNNDEEKILDDIMTRVGIEVKYKRLLIKPFF